MKGVQALIVAAGVLAAMPAPAQTLDLSTIKCRDFLAANKENVSIILAWMDAYYKPEDSPPVIDFEKMGKNAERLAASCADKPDNGLITVADSLFDK